MDGWVGTGFSSGTSNSTNLITKATMFLDLGFPPVIMGFSDRIEKIE